MPLDIDQLKQLDQRAKTEQFTHEDCQLVRRLLGTHLELASLLKDPNTSLDDVYQYLGTAENDAASDGAASDRGKSVSRDPHE